MRRKLLRYAFFLIQGCFSPYLILAQVTLKGKVTEKGTGIPLPGTTIYIPDLKTGTVADATGNYFIINLPQSTILVQASYIGFKAKTATIDLEDSTVLDFTMEATAIEAQEVVVTGNALSSDNSRTSNSITPISKLQLLTAASTNIINSISEVPGVSAITTGDNISKPVIRGLGYNHVVTLNDGVRQEGNQWGDEHGIEIDQFSADRIEVLKGPASLFYGSDAMGGVINILEPIPAAMGTISGEVTSHFSVNDRLTSNSLMFQGNHDGFVWRIRGTYKNAASYSTPTEYVYNSCFNEKDLGILAGINKRWGFTHFHFSTYNTKLGSIEGERDSLTHKFIGIDGQIVPDDVASGREIEVPFQVVSHYKASSVSNLVFHENQFRINFGYQVNDRKEYGTVADSPDLYFRLKTLTYEARFTRLLGHSLEVSAGVSGMTQSNLNRGTEFLVPDYDLQDAGGFLYAKKSFEKFTVNLGMRFDSRWVEGKPLYLDDQGIPSQSGDTLFHRFSSRFSAFTGSAGMTFRLNEIWNFKFNIGRGYRAPNIAELASNGLHEGTFRYEIGNNSLHEETSIQIDGEISANTRFMNAVFNGFYNIVNNFIYYRNTNDEKKQVNGTYYPVYRYIQGNSLLKGFEFEFDIHPIDPFHFDNSIDYVWGENLSTGIPLPNIPALHSVHDFRWNFRSKKLKMIREPYIEAGIEIHYRQDRIDTFETETAGYVLLNASIGTNLQIGHQVWNFFLTGKNLTNEKYFDHMNRLKYYGIYNMGINLTIGIVIRFGILDQGR